MTQTDILKRYLTNDWTPSHQLIKVNTPYGYLGTSADREARRLAENGEIESKRDGKFVYFRRKKPQFGSSKDIHEMRWKK